MVVPILNDWGQVGACYNSCIVIRCFFAARLPCEEGSFISNDEYFMVIISITVEPRQLKLPWERKSVQDKGVCSTEYSVFYHKTFCRFRNVS